LIISLTDAITFKEEIKQAFQIELHFHDGCGGQYFSLDAGDASREESIRQYFASKQLRAFFSPDGLQFTVEKGKSC
jgi:hypothetical protein